MSRNQRICHFVLLVVFIFFMSPVFSQNTNDRFSEGFFDVNECHIYYQRTGIGTPLIFIHCSLLDHSMWDEEVQFLSKEYSVITIDLPGSGKTKGENRPVPVSQVLLALLDRLGIDKADFAGLSLGSVCVFDFMVLHPERIHKVILTSTPLLGSDGYIEMDPSFMGWAGSFTGALRQKDTVAAAEVFMQTWFDGPNRKALDMPDALRHQMLNTVLINLRLHKNDGSVSFSAEPPIRKIGSIHFPVMIIDGEKDMPYIHRCSDYLAQNITGAKHFRMPGAAHMVNLEKPTMYNEVLLKFLRE